MLIRKTPDGPKSRTDIHCHILPGIDDGAVDWDESIEMARVARDSGTTRLFATPHLRTGLYHTPGSQIKALANELSERIKEAGIDLTIFPGCEVHISPELPRMFARGEIVTLADSGFVLLELPFDFLPPYTLDTIFELMMKGAGIILAHPERNAVLRKDTRSCEELIAKGIYFQINSGSLTGVYGKEVEMFVQRLLKKDMVHFLGSDAHGFDPNRRGPDMSKALHEMCKISHRRSGIVEYLETNVELLLSGRLP